jgi:hypothetical protein
MTKRQIDLVAFQKLEWQKQLDLLYKDGVHIGKKRIENKTAILYQLNHFYVEVIYEVYRKKINTIRHFTELNCLESYIDQVPVRDLDKKKKK